MRFFLFICTFVGFSVMAELSPTESISDECRILNAQLHDQTLDCLRNYDGFTEPFSYCGNRSVSRFGLDSELFQNECLSLTKKTLYSLCLRWEDNMSYTAESYCSKLTYYVP